MTTWNPSDKSSGINLSGSNLIASNAASAGNVGVRANFSAITGKFYHEVFVTANDQTYYNTVGISKLSAALSAIYSGTNGIGVAASGTVVKNGTNGISLGTTTVSNTLCIAVDLGGQLIWFRVNAGNWNANAGYSPGGTGGIDISTVGSIAGATAAPSMASSSSTLAAMNVTANFGASGFTYSQPSGFLKWTTPATARSYSTMVW